MQRTAHSFSLYSTLDGTVNSFSFSRPNAAAVPEPGSLALVGLSVLGLAAVRRGRRLTTLDC